jgi:hypothetical protein
MLLVKYMNGAHLKSRNAQCCISVFLALKLTGGGAQNFRGIPLSCSLYRLSFRKANTGQTSFRNSRKIRLNFLFSAFSLKKVSIATAADNPGLDGGGALHIAYFKTRGHLMA